MNALPEKKGPTQSEEPANERSGHDAYYRKVEVNNDPGVLTAGPGFCGRGVTVIRSLKSKRSRFARIDNSVLQCSTLSFRARGILAFVLSKPENWRHNAENLAANSNDGLHAIRSALRELCAVGHARLIRVRDERGRVVNRWIFREEPSAENREPVGHSPSAENQNTDSASPSDGLPGAGQPAFGQPESGAPKPGKPALFETTVGETTVKETTEVKRECVGTPTLDVLKTQFPGINVDAQWKSYILKYPHGGPRHFAEHWLPKAESMPAAIHAAAKPSGIPEPKGWREFVQGHYAKECTLWMLQWIELDRVQQKKISDDMTVQRISNS